MKDDRVYPSWLVPSRVQALTTTRANGLSVGQFAQFNLADHVGDRRAAVNANREKLRKEIGCQRIQWLNQVHGNRIVQATAASTETVPEADGAWTQESEFALAVLTADCLSVVVCDNSSSLIGIAHAGWRGLLDGVLQNLLKQMPADAQCLSAWIGPSIGGCVYEVGEEVASAVIPVASALGLTADQQETVLRPGVAPGKFFFDMALLAGEILKECGINDVTAMVGGCTYTDRRFYSYRRDGETGRMATVIWLRP